MKVTLWRATDRVDSYASGSAFAADEEDAEAYLDNPGFGGATLLAVEVEFDPSRVLTLVGGSRDGIPYGQEARNAWRTLAEALGRANKNDEYENKEAVRTLIEHAEGYIHHVIDSRKNRDALNKNGYDWIVYQDSYPDGAVTWVYLGAPVALEGFR